MIEWKQSICVRLGFPKLSEDTFNRAWDITSDAEKEILVNSPTLETGRRFAEAIFFVLEWKGPADMPAKPLEDWQRCALHVEYGYADYKVLLTRDHELYYKEHVGDLPTYEECQSNRRYLKNLFAMHRKDALDAVLKGYALDELVPYELHGEIKKDWSEILQVTEYYWNLYDKYVHPVPITSFRGDYAFLSNFEKCDIEYEGLTYQSVEAAFQAAKTLYPSERKPFCDMMPAVAKRMGRQVKLRDDWEFVKVDIMRQLLLKKFAYGSFLYQKLSETQGLALIEGNTWHDNFWGDCTCSRCQSKQGKNMLGQLLMEIREMTMTQRAIAEGHIEDKALVVGKNWDSIIYRDRYLVNSIYKAAHVDAIACEYVGTTTLYITSGPVPTEGYFKAYRDDLNHTLTDTITVKRYLDYITVPGNVCIVKASDVTGVGQ